MKRLITSTVQLESSQVTHWITPCSSFRHQSNIHRTVAFRTIWSAVPSAPVDESGQIPSHAISMECAPATIIVVINDLIANDKISAAQITPTDSVCSECVFVKMDGVAEGLSCQVSVLGWDAYLLRSRCRLGSCWFGVR